MYIKHLSATLFRNYTRLELDLPARINVFQGANAQGKTNLLEMIYYLATCKSPLASNDRQLMNWDADHEVIPHSDLQVVFVRGAAEYTLDVTLVKELQPGEPSESAVLRRQFRLDGVPRRAMDIVGRLNAVLFLPQDIELVSGSPTARRRYLDISLCQIDPLYCQTLSRYNRIISQRNALLKQLRERNQRADELTYWDEQLAALGAYILWQRLWAVRQLQPEADSVQQAVSDNQERLALDYQDTLTARVEQGMGLTAGQSDPARQQAQCDQLSSAYHAALAAARREEIARAVTLIGPHRDDLRFLINGIDATIYGSRGQQRSVALALKLAEVQLMRQRTGEMPVLLLDDVVSELDQQRCRLLLRAVAEAQQVLITTTDLQAYSVEFLHEAALWDVKGGAITPWLSNANSDPAPNQ